MPSEARPKKITEKIDRTQNAQLINGSASELLNFKVQFL